MFTFNIHNHYEGQSEAQHVQLVALFEGVKAEIQNLGAHLMKRTEVIQLVKDTAAEVKASIAAAIEKEKADVIAAIDAAIADPENNISAADGQAIKDEILGIGSTLSTDIDKISEAKAAEVPTS